MPGALLGHAGLDGIRSLLYGRASRGAVRDALAGLLVPDAELGTVRLERAKFKPGRKLTGYYRAEVRLDSGTVTRLIEVTWFAEPAAVGSDAQPDESAMEEHARAAGVAAPFAGLRKDMPSLGIAVRVAPLDVRFPQLVSLMQPDHVARLLTQAGVARSAAATYRVTAIRYRPRQRHVLRYDPLDGEGGPVFAKLYRGSGAERALRIADAIADTVAQVDSGLSAARPIAALADDGVVLFALVPGVPLSARLDGTATMLGRLRSAGVLLRLLQEDCRGPAGDLKEHDLGQELTAIARAAEHLGALAPAAAAQVEWLLARAEQIGASLPGEPVRFAHGDYKSDHVWVDRNRLTLLDFDTCCYADPALDVGKFLADLSWWYALRRLPGLDTAQRSFLDGYGPIPEARLTRARLYQALVLAKITIRRFRRFEADWVASTEAGIGRAVDVLKAFSAG